MKHGGRNYTRMIVGEAYVLWSTCIFSMSFTCVPNWPVLHTGKTSQNYILVHHFVFIAARVNSGRFRTALQNLDEKGASEMSHSRKFVEASLSKLHVSWNRGEKSADEMFMHQCKKVYLWDWGYRTSKAGHLVCDVNATSYRTISWWCLTCATTGAQITDARVKIESILLHVCVLIHTRRNVLSGRKYSWEQNFLEYWLCNKQFRSVEEPWFCSVAYVVKEH